MFTARYGLDLSIQCAAMECEEFQMAVVIDWVQYK